MQNKTLKNLVLIFLTLAYSSIAHSEIYQWEDQHGNIHYSDSPPEQNIKSTKIKQPNAQSIIKGSEEDSKRKRQQAADWRKQRYQQSQTEALKKKRDKKIRKAELNSEKKKCERYQKKLNDIQKKLKAHKRAGIRPAYESKLRIRIEQYQRDVDYYCR